jgi:predicted RNase H-like nuclease (RuvC/YqgF family)
MLPKNLARALDHSRSQTQDAARSILVEARLRAEVTTMMSQRDEAIGQAEEYKHKATLVQEQLHNQQTKLSRVTQEKIKLERDFMASQRATKTLVQNMETNTTTTDNEYYNRKISELTGRLQSQNAVIAEKNRQIEEMRRQLERSISQTRWTTMSSSASAAGKRT